MDKFSENLMTEYIYNASTTVSSDIADDNLFFGRHQFITTQPWLAIPCLIILVIASIVGTFGNILTFLMIASKKRHMSEGTIFIVNLAISDLYVTMLADPMSIVAKVEGEEFFESVPQLCQAIASMCTISCVTSLMTIGLMSINRYIYICVNDYYERIFTKTKCICMCISVYFVGLFLVSLNGANIGDHGFDRKSIECIWDRMASFPYTVVFSTALVWIPSVVIGVCYLKIYLFVRSHKKRMRQQCVYGKRTRSISFRLAKTLFMIYAVFVTCWAPYALLIALDIHDNFPYESHLIITVFAHLHPSVNWIIYYLTNRRFAASYRQVLLKCKLCILCKVQSTFNGPKAGRQRETGGSSFPNSDRPKYGSKSNDFTGSKDSGIASGLNTTNC